MVETSQTTIKIQVYSDLHIEKWNKVPNLPAKTKYLFLAGDICQLSHPLFYKFFYYCSSHWEKVFYTPGNQEFYSRKKTYNILDFEYKLKLNEKFKNVYYLNNNSAPLNENIEIYGTTFWTIPPFLSTDVAKYYSNDYNSIRYFDNERKYPMDLTTNYVNFLSNESYNGLQTFLNETKKKVIIMTHFPPMRTQSMDPKFLTQNNNLLKSYFSWPDDTLSNILVNSYKPPLIWISGHTHWSYYFYKNNIRFISNQLGYKNELGLTGLNEDGVYEISVDDGSSCVS
jgi:predicted phosphodiesterase